MGDTSRMTGDSHVRICEGLGVKFPGATRQVAAIGYYPLSKSLSITKPGKPWSRPPDGSILNVDGGDAMDQEILANPGFMAEILDAYPAPTLIVDEDVRVLFASRAAREYLGLDRDALQSVVLQRGGHALHCVNAEAVPEGCGRAPACKECVVRNSVQAAFRTRAVQRSRALPK